MFGVLGVGSHMKKTRILNGYRLIYKPNSPSAMVSKNWTGYLYEHIFVAEQMIGRSLHENEVVHHLDGNKLNNRRSNLIVIHRAVHKKLHDWLDQNVVNFSVTSIPVPVCIVCEETLQEKEVTCCSRECVAAHQKRAVWPSKDVLKKEIQENSWKELGRKYGVSDNAVRRWAKKYQLI